MEDHKIRRAVIALFTAEDAEVTEISKGVISGLLEESRSDAH